MNMYVNSAQQKVKNNLKQSNNNKNKANKIHDLQKKKPQQQTT